MSFWLNSFGAWSTRWYKEFKICVDWRPTALARPAPAIPLLGALKVAFRTWHVFDRTICAARFWQKAGGAALLSRLVSAKTRCNSASFPSVFGRLNGNEIERCAILWPLAYSRGDFADRGTKQVSWHVWCRNHTAPMKIWVLFAFFDKVSAIPSVRVKLRRWVTPHIRIVGPLVDRLSHQFGFFFICKVSKFGNFHTDPNFWDEPSYNMVRSLALVPNLERLPQSKLISLLFAERSIVDWLKESAIGESVSVNSI